MKPDHSSEAMKALQTYGVYARAWRLAVPSTHRLLRRQQPLLERQPTRSGPLEAEIHKHLMRGSLTLRLIREIAVDEQPDFATIAAFWLPVQCYYAVHGYGMAALVALGVTPPGSHRAFLKSIGERVVRRFMPAPYSMRVAPGFHKCAFFPEEQRHIVGMSELPNIDRRISNLERPTTATCYTHIVRSLETTRKRLLDERFSQARRKKRAGTTRKNLTKDMKREMAQALHETTIFDYIYRARVRSSYDDPSMFLLGEDSTHVVLDFVRSMRAIAWQVCTLLESTVVNGTTSALHPRIFKGVGRIAGAPGK